MLTCPFMDESRLEYLTHILASDDRSPSEAGQLARLVTLFSDSEPPPRSAELFPRFTELQRRLNEVRAGGSADEIEEAFLNVYEHVHMIEAPYTPDERARVNRAGGYWAHAGGISPLLKAQPHLRPEAISVDIGAGNGLQCLLLQWLYPHRRSIQIEISSRMIDIGRTLQQWIGVPQRKIEWRCEDVLEARIPDADFVYLYRPVRPEGLGRGFYKSLGEALIHADHEIVVFSIADCLGEYLMPAYERFYYDGQLSCFHGPLAEPESRRTPPD